MVVEELTFGGWDNEELHKLFNFLEFRTLVGPPARSSGARRGRRRPTGAVLEVEVIPVRDANALSELSPVLAGSGVPAVSLAGSWAGTAGLLGADRGGPGAPLGGVRTGSPIDVLAEPGGADRAGTRCSSGACTPTTPKP